MEQNKKKSRRKWFESRVVGWIQVNKVLQWEGRRQKAYLELDAWWLAGLSITQRDLTKADWTRVDLHQLFRSNGRLNTVTKPWWMIRCGCVERKSKRRAWEITTRVFFPKRTVTTCRDEYFLAKYLINILILRNIILKYICEEYGRNIDSNFRNPSFPLVNQHNF